MKKLSVLFVAICAGMAANASYLYWQVAASDYQNITEPGRVTAVNVWAVNTATKDKSYVDGYRVESGTVNMSQAQMIDVSAFSSGSYSFYIELANYSSGYQNLGNTVEQTPYADMVTKNYILEKPLSVSQAVAWHGGSSGYAAPEPTSGLLMLLGVAALGLKRRKA